MKTLFAAEELAKFRGELNKKMDVISSTKRQLQHITPLKRSNEDFIRKCEENEQHGR